MPYNYTCDNMMPNVGWNKADSPCFGAFWGQHGAELSFTLETAYFIAHGVRFSLEKAVETGRCFAEALEKYLEYNN